MATTTMLSALPLSSQPLTLTNAGAIDYIGTFQVEKLFVDLAYGYPNGTTKGDVNGFSVGDAYGIGTIGLPDISSMNSIAAIADGTSQTTMICELAGRNSLYYTGGVAQTVAGTGGTGGDADWQQNWGGGAWVDPNNGTWKLYGRAQNGAPVTNAPGPCAINCSNGRSGQHTPLRYSAGMYSFHTGGVQVVMCDGSVRFLSQNINNIVLISIISAAGSETVGEF